MALNPTRHKTGHFRDIKDIGPLQLPGWKLPPGFHSEPDRQRRLFQACL